MNETELKINLALRTAAGHYRAANDVLTTAESTCEMKYKSAGASVWEAWCLAVRALPEMAGRKLDDKALARLFSSPKRRPWWDKHLAAVKVEGKPATRDWASRTLQWHLDPDAARARRAQQRAVTAGHQRKVREAAAKVHSRYSNTEKREPTTAEFRKVVERVTSASGTEGALARAERDEIERLLSRLGTVVRSFTNPVKRAEATAALRDLIETMEALQ